MERFEGITYDRFCDLPWSVSFQGGVKSSQAGLDRIVSGLPDSEFALICHGPGGEVHRLLPMATSDLTKTSAGILVGLSDVLPREMVSGVGAALVLQLRAQGQKCPEQLSKVSGRQLKRIWYWDEAWQPLPSLPRPSRKKESGAPVHTFNVSPNPLKVQDKGFTAQVGSLADAEYLRTWLSKNSHALSSLTKHEIATGLLEAYEKLGTDPYDSRHARTYFGELHKMSRNLDAPSSSLSLTIETRREALDELEILSKEKGVKESSDDLWTSCMKTYRAIINDVEAGVSLESARDLAVKVSHLDEVLGIQDRVPGAFESFFEPCTVKVSKPVDDTGVEVIYSQDAMIIREEDLKLLELMPMTAPKQVFDEEVIKGFRSDPVKTFRALTPSSKRWMARWMYDHVKGRRVDGERH